MNSQIKYCSNCRHYVNKKCTREPPVYLGFNNWSQPKPEEDDYCRHWEQEFHERTNP